MKSLFAGLALLSLSSCVSCDPPPDPPPVETPVGSVRLDTATGSATLVLVGLEQPLTAFQVDVVVDGGSASAFLAIADHDIVEAGLAAEDGGPKSRFTAVVSDTRRLPLNSGNLARLTLDEGATVTLSNALGIDQQGKKRALKVVAQ